MSAVRLGVGLAAGLALLGAAAVTGAPQNAATAPGMWQAKPALDGNRAPYHLRFSSDGKRAFVTEMAEGSVAVIDTETRSVTARFSTGGERPAGLALTPDGTTLLVANSFSNSVGMIEVASGKLLATVRVPGMPYGVVVSGDGKRAYVTASQLNQVAVLDVPAARVTETIPVGQRPRALALTGDGLNVVVANLAGGSVSVIDTETLKEEARVRLKGVNVRGIAVTEDGTEAYCTLMPAFNGKPTDDPKEVWHNLVQAVRLEGADSAVGEDQWMDFARVPGSTEVIGTPDQHDIVLDNSATHAWMAVAGRDVVTRITIHDRKRDAIWPISQVETPVGANPRGLALTPDGKQVWVANHLGNSLSIVDAATARLVGTVDLGPASHPDPTLLGQYLFNNAGLTRGRRFSCASCHPDGAADGLTWNFVHVADGFRRRNSRDLRGGLAGTAPFRWSGLESQLSAFVEDEVTGLLGGPKPTPEQAAALVAAVEALRLPPNPYRQANGEMTAQAREGKLLFEGKAGCGTCHTGPRAGGSGMKAWIGTTPEGQQVDVPHLEGVYDSAPHLHDGRAATLEEIFEKYNEAGRHGNAHQLNAAERAAVLHYLREL